MIWVIKHIIKWYRLLSERFLLHFGKLAFTGLYVASILKIVFPVAANTALRLHAACVFNGRTIADFTC